MGLPKGKIELCLKWLDVCFILKDYIKGFGLKIVCLNHILNRVHTKVVLQVTHKEKWSGRKLDISNFKIFGSEYWAYILDENIKG